jgi:hypothetical protein
MHPMRTMPVKKNITVRDTEFIEDDDASNNDKLAIINTLPSRSRKTMNELNAHKLKLNRSSIYDQMSSKYTKNCKIFDRQLSNIDEISGSRSYLSSRDIPCVKYNYSLDSEVQNFSCFDSVIRLSEDLKTLNIYNMKPIPNDKYVLEADPCELEKIRLREQIFKIEAKNHEVSEEVAKGLLEERTKHMDIAEIHEILVQVKEEMKRKNLNLDLEEEEKKQDEFKRIQSSACCEVADIQNIIFGPTTSRFWIFRKHMNTIPQEKFRDENNIPFLSWQCLTLELKHRNVDLVIKD